MLSVLTTGSNTTSFVIRLRSNLVTANVKALSGIQSALAQPLTTFTKTPISKLAATANELRDRHNSTQKRTGASAASQKASANPPVNAQTDINHSEIEVSLGRSTYGHSIEKQVAATTCPTSDQPNEVSCAASSDHRRSNSGIRRRPITSSATSVTA